MDESVELKQKLPIFKTTIDIYQDDSEIKPSMSIGLGTAFSGVYDLQTIAEVFVRSQCHIIDKVLETLVIMTNAAGQVDFARLKDEMWLSEENQLLIASFSNTTKDQLASTFIEMAKKIDIYQIIRDKILETINLI